MLLFFDRNEYRVLASFLRPPYAALHLSPQAFAFMRKNVDFHTASFRWKCPEENPIFIGVNHLFFTRSHDLKHNHRLFVNRKPCYFPINSCPFSGRGWYHVAVANTLVHIDAYVQQKIIVGQRDIHHK